MFNEPPVTMHVSHAASVGFTALIVSFSVISVAIAIILARRTRNPINLLIAAGGPLAVLWEPTMDAVARVWYPTNSIAVLFHSYRVGIPLWVPFAYLWFMGGLTAIAYSTIESGASRRKVWHLALLFMFFDLCAELIGLRTHNYIYWGRQPLDLLGFPLYWAPINASLPIVGALLIQRLRSRLSGWRSAGIPLLIPMVYAAVVGAAAWPAWLVMNSHASVAEISIAGCLSIALAFFVIWIALETLPSDVSPSNSGPVVSSEVPTRT